MSLTTHISQAESPEQMTYWSLFFLLLHYKSNELLILSSFPHFLLWLCMPLLHCLNLLFCAALGSSLSILLVSEAQLLWPGVGVWHQRSWVRNTEIQLHVELSPTTKSIGKELVLISTHWGCSRTQPATSCPPHGLIPQPREPPCWASCCQWRAFSFSLFCKSIKVLTVLCKSVPSGFLWFL